MTCDINEVYYVVSYDVACLSSQRSPGRLIYSTLRDSSMRRLPAWSSTTPRILVALFTARSTCKTSSRVIRLRRTVYTCSIFATPCFCSDSPFPPSCLQKLHSHPGWRNLWGHGESSLPFHCEETSSFRMHLLRSRTFVVMVGVEFWVWCMDLVAGLGSGRFVEGTWGKTGWGPACYKAPI